MVLVIARRQHVKDDKFMAISGQAHALFLVSSKHETGLASRSGCLAHTTSRTSSTGSWKLWLCIFLEKVINSLQKTIFSA